MTFVKLSIAALLIAFLTGCATSPMNKPYGPMDTPAFKPIALDLVNDGSKSILFKAPFVSIFVNDELQSIFSYKSFMITEHGAYVINWNIGTYQYSLVYSIKAEEIKNIADHTIVKNYLPDRDLILITDMHENTVGIEVERRLAAKKALQQIKDNIKN
jgi:hypothetical protein